MKINSHLTIRRFRPLLLLLAGAMGLLASCVVSEEDRMMRKDAPTNEIQMNFVVSRAVMPLPDLVRTCRKNISPTPHNALPNGLLCLKGGEVENEIRPFRAEALTWDLKDYFEEEFFRTKKVVFVAIHNGTPRHGKE